MHKQQPHVTIHVTGPVSTGKTLVLALIKQMLEGLSAHVACNAEISATCRDLQYGPPEQWEEKLIKQANWTLTEETVAADTPERRATQLEHERGLFEKALPLPANVFWSATGEYVAEYDREYLHNAATQTNDRWKVWKLARVTA